MDVSELCITTNDSEENVTLPPLENRVNLPVISELKNSTDPAHQHSVNNNIYQNPYEYHQRYQSTPSPQLQHQQYNTTNHFPFTNPSRVSTQDHHDNPAYFASTSNLPSQPLSEGNRINSIPPQNGSPIFNQLLEQCTSIYARIGKYRKDSLTESERNSIIDQVYFTAEKMISSIQNQLQMVRNDIELITPPLQSQKTVVSTDMEITDSNQTDDNQLSVINNKVEDMDEYKIIRQARNLQDVNARPKYRRRSKRSMIGQRCHSCNTTETPEWRRGPDGARTLCNACGLHYSKLLRRGSITVQTHNYAAIESGNTSNNTPSDFKRAPRIIQFPIIQVNSNASRQAPTSSSFNNSMNSKPSRITEIFSDEDDDLSNNKIDDTS